MVWLSRIFLFFISPSVCSIPNAPPFFFCHVSPPTKSLLPADVFHKLSLFTALFKFHNKNGDDGTDHTTSARPMEHRSGQWNTDGRSLSSLYFTFNGKPLPDSATLSESRIASLSTLTLHCRLRGGGGGGDGGATGTESRDCYLNMYASKKPDKVDPNEMRLSKWLDCSLSNEPLKRPVVIDKLGNLFNKEALVEALLANGTQIRGEKMETAETADGDSRNGQWNTDGRRGERRWR